MEIETVAAKSPEKIMREPSDPFAGLRKPFQTGKLAKQLSFEQSQTKAVQAKLFRRALSPVGCDCWVVKINPLVVTKGGGVCARCQI